MNSSFYTRASETEEYVRRFGISWLIDQGELRRKEKVQAGSCQGHLLWSIIMNTWALISTDMMENFAGPFDIDMRPALNKVPCQIKLMWESVVDVVYVIYFSML